MTEDHHEASVSISSGSLLLVAFVLLALCFFLLLSRRKGAEGREHKGKEGAKIECEKDKGNRTQGIEADIEKKVAEDHHEAYASIMSGSLFLFASVLLILCFCSPSPPCFLSASPFCALPCSH